MNKHINRVNSKWLRQKMLYSAKYHTYDQKFSTQLRDKVFEALSGLGPVLCFRLSQLKFPLKSPRGIQSSDAPLPHDGFVRLNPISDFYARRLV